MSAKIIKFYQTYAQNVNFLLAETEPKHHQSTTKAPPKYNQGLPEALPKKHRIIPFVLTATIALRSGVGER